MNLDFKSYTENTDIVVTYSPKQVDYIVEHKIENITQDDYTLKEKETKQDYVDSEVSATAKDYDGFKAITPLQTEKIPAEGTLTLEVKYKRNIYRLSYNTDGGSYIPSERRVFEETLTSPEPPVKQGYQFNGWEPELPATMPAKNLELKAKWLEEDETPFKYAYYLQNADDDSYTLLGYVEGTAKTNSPVTLPIGGAGFEHLALFPIRNNAYAAYGIPALVTNQREFNKYFVFDEAKTRSANDGNLVTGDGKTIVPLYFDRQVYTVAFGNNPSNYNDPKRFFPEIKMGDKIYTKENPYKIQVRFGEDYTDRMPTGANITNIPDGMTFYRPMYVKGTGYGSWMAAEGPYRFNAHMAYCSPQTVVDLSDDPNFPYVQYIYLELQTSKHKLEVYEHFQEIDGSYKTLDKPTGIKRLNSGTWYYAPSDYQGFLPDSNKIDYYKVKQDGTLGDLSRGFLIRRNGKPSLGVGSQLQLPDGSFETIEEGYPDVDGIVHVYYGRRSYNVYFYVDPDKQTEDLQKQVLYEDSIRKGLPSLDQIQAYKPSSLTDEYQFDGWYKDRAYVEKLQDDEVMPANALTLFAKWTPKYGEITVTVKPENGKEPTTLTYDYGEQIGWDTLANPEKKGFTFTNWYTELEDGTSNQIYDFSSKLTQNITLVAKYEENKISSVTVKFIKENGEEVAEEDVHEQQIVGQDYTYRAKLVDRMLPDTSSKKISVQPNPDDNVLVFTYKPFKTINYTVRYVTRSAGADGSPIEEEIADSLEVTTERNIDTQDAINIAGYQPQSLRRTLQLSQNPEDNVMTFVYVKKTPDQAPYTVKYYFEIDDGKYQPDEQKTLNFSGKVGSEVTVGGDQLPETINGYKLNREKSKLTGTITVEPTLELQVYYDKIKVTPNPDPDTPTEPSTPSKPTDSTTPTLPGNLSDPYKPGELTEPTAPNEQLYRVIYKTTPDSRNVPEDEKLYRLGDQAVVLHAPTRAGYRFLGWRMNPLLQPGDVVTFHEGHDIILTAEWEQDTTPTTSRQEPIASTGENVGQLYLAGVGFLLAGAVLVVLRKREQSKH